MLERVRQMVYESQKVDIDQVGHLLIAAEDVLTAYLKEHPKDTEVWLLLLMIEYNPPLADAGRIINYAKQILSYDESNPYALLFWAYADYYLKANGDEDLYGRLLRVELGDNELMSMIEVAKARYCELRDLKKYEEFLLKSIDYYGSHVMNYRMLGELYIEQGKKVEGQFLIKHALENISRLVTRDEPSQYDPTSLTKFLAEFFAGTIINYVEYGRLIAVSEKK